MTRVPRDGTGPRADQPIPQDATDTMATPTPVVADTHRVRAGAAGSSTDDPAIAAQVVG